MYRNVLNQNYSYFFLVLLLNDLFLIICSEFISCNLILHKPFFLEHMLKSICIIGIFLFPIFSYIGIYDPIRGSSYNLITKKIIFSYVTFFTIFSFVLYLVNQRLFVERVPSLAVFSAISILLFVLTRILLMLFLRAIRKRNLNTRSVVIVGDGEVGENIYKRFSEYLWTGYRIQAYIKSNHFSEKDEPISYLRGVPVYSEPKMLSLWITMKRIDEIWFALPMSEEHKIKKMLWDLRHKPIPKRYIPDVLSVGALSSSLGDVSGITIYDLEGSKIRGKSIIVKDLLDKFLATIILILISPIMIFISIAIKITSRGPIFFKQKRYGIYGNVIIIYKFRTMKIHNDSGFIQQTKRNDPRLTLIGGFLRRTSLDELPQFFNVLQGRMSIVGPRPHAISHNEYYKDLVDLYMQRHLIKPGITGLAQVSGSRGETDTVEKMQKRVNFDIQYIKNWSVFLDFKIIFLTIFKGFFNDNAY